MKAFIKSIFSKSDYPPSVAGILVPFFALCLLYAISCVPKEIIFPTSATCQHEPVRKEYTVVAILITTDTVGGLVLYKYTPLWSKSTTQKAQNGKIIYQVY